MASLFFLWGGAGPYFVAQAVFEQQAGLNVQAIFNAALAAATEPVCDE